MRKSRTKKPFRTICIILTLLLAAEIVVWGWMSDRYQNTNRTVDADLRIEEAVLYRGRSSEEDAQQA